MTNNLLVMDTETGGVNSKKNGMCSITLKVYGKPIMETIFVKPVKELEYTTEAFNVTGLSLEILEEKGLPEANAVHKIKTFISRNFYGKPSVLGQNIFFDFNFMNEMFLRHGDTNFMDYVWGFHRDTMINSIFLNDAEVLQLQKFRLDHVYQKLKGTPFSNAHTSEADVLATEELYRMQMEILKKIKDENREAKKIHNKSDYSALNSIQQSVRDNEFNNV